MQIIFGKTTLILCSTLSLLSKGSSSLILLRWTFHFFRSKYSKMHLKSFFNQEVAFFAWIYQGMDHWESGNAFFGPKKWPLWYEEESYKTHRCPAKWNASFSPHSLRWLAIPPQYLILEIFPSFLRKRQLTGGFCLYRWWVWLSSIMIN